ncbi:unnamed protein product [Parnassius apollo]|uniref:(apollo) hypothetical protein n=1 Tax=Parnassius apollo TaxID=110799 RepID=A0A8S3XF37_PARAO|nr:unnamed protein product [Parnassius apollo]
MLPSITGGCQCQLSSGRLQACPHPALISRLSAFNVASVCLLFNFLQRCTLYLAEFEQNYVIVLFHKCVRIQNDVRV